MSFVLLAHFVRRERCFVRFSRFLAFRHGLLERDRWRLRAYAISWLYVTSARLVLPDSTRSLLLLTFFPTVDSRSREK